MSPDAASQSRAFIKTGRDRTPLEIVPPAITSENAKALLDNGDGIRVRRQDGAPGYLSVLQHTGWETGVVFPIVVNGRLVGVVMLADAKATERSEEDLAQGRRLANQVAVALSNAHLVEALDRLNVGTLNALARTVDAKSPWTAGHSQRVTAMAVQIGRQMGLGRADLDTITRGGLLHDIGKIAVPSAILNKSGPLTTEEFALMKEHPATGARILEPIPEYARLIPIVLQHHEKFDGRGYPAGLAGEEISVEARVVAVADVYDALTSKRPYRGAMEHLQACSIIRARAGTHFDRRMVEAFFAVLDGNRAPQELQALVVR